MDDVRFVCAGKILELGLALHAVDTEAEIPRISLFNPSLFCARLSLFERLK